MAMAMACGDAGRPSGASAPASGFISTRDVHHFVAAMRRMTPGDSGCAWLEPYFRGATDGLVAYNRHFGVHQATLCSAVLRSPARYARIDSARASFDSGAVRTEHLFEAFERIYPAARPVAVYFVVGTGIAAETNVGLIDPVVLIDAIRHRSIGDVAPALLRELIRAQQHFPVLGALTDGPQFLRGSVLRHSIEEGSADFLVALVTGEVRHNSYAERHEAKLWNDFRRDMYGTDYSHWLYNDQYPARGTLPPNLGYWMGYQITQAFYEKATDKTRAIHDILNIQDFDDFLTRSGYDGPRTPPT